MSEAEPAPEPAPPVRGQWAWQRVAALPAAVRQRCLDNAVGSLLSHALTCRPSVAAHNIQTHSEE
jgi:hypothetical protein